MLRLPPGIFTVTGLFTNPIRTAALAAAQEEDPEAWVSPAPRSQIRMKSSLGAGRHSELHVRSLREQGMVL